jgi:hypothetical protein
MIGRNRARGTMRTTVHNSTQDQLTKAGLPIGRTLVIDARGFAVTAAYVTASGCSAVARNDVSRSLNFAKIATANASGLFINKVGLLRILC